MDKKEVFKKFLETNDTLIVDKNPASRGRLFKIMYDLGAPRDSVHVTDSLSEAEEIIQNKNVGIILSDYYITGGSGFDLFKMVREKNGPKRTQCLILVTSNISQTAVAKAAEEDVDSFIIKPFTMQGLEDNLVSSVSAKAAPTDYVLKIEEGKTLIGSGQYESALETLEKAVSLSTKPSLALFYMGQAEYLKNRIDRAEGSYNQGLTFNSIHFKCLVGLYEVFMRMNRFEDAYQVVKKIAHYFPANQDRLTQIVRLAIQTKNYEDMQTYYEIFSTLEFKNEVLTNYIGSGLYVSGKHFLMNHNVSKAIQFFDHIISSCSGQTKFIRALIGLLLDYGKLEEASQFLTRFPAEGFGEEDFLVSAYLVTSRTIHDPHRLVKDGMDLHNKNIRDYDCMKILVDNMRKSGVNRKKIEPLEDEMFKLWPDKFSDQAA